jgi:predicted nuclease of predicted toxin-antitoxin system
VKFLVDAHLPRRLCAILVQHGHDATHTLDLPTGNKTKDSIINQVSVLEQRVVVSKDSDFFYSHVLQGRPWKLLLIKTGNISSQGTPSSHLIPPTFRLKPLTFHLQLQPEPLHRCGIR